MAVLALSTLGAVAGNAIGIGASAGWLIGSFIGNSLFSRGTKTEGPRLSDLTVQSSAEGAPIPICFGTVRLAGNLIWSSGLKEKRTKKKVGGKGMGGSATQVSYTYSASFAIGLCEGPIAGILRVWADSKLIYDVRTGTNAATLYASRSKLRALRIYTGSETQPADPVIQAYQGIANTPAFRGLAYLVVEELQLADFANRIPNITVEVVVAGTSVQPYRVNTWAPSLPGSEARSCRNIGGIIEYTTLASGFQTVERRTIDGVILSVQKTPVTDSFGDRTQNYPRLQRTISGWQRDGVTFPRSSSPFGTDDTNVSYSPVLLGGYVFLMLEGPTNPLGIARYPGGISPVKNPDKFFNMVTAGYIDNSTQFGWADMFTGDDGLLYCKFAGTLGAQNKRLIALDADLNVMAGYNYPGDVAGAETSTVYDGHLMDTTSIKVRVLLLTSPTLTLVNETNFSGGAGDLQSLGNGLGLRADGVFSLLPSVTPSGMTVASAVSAICQRCGLAPSDIDVTALTDTLSGYVFTQRPGRSAIEPLRQTFFFDGVESGDNIVFKKRGGAVVATLTNDDLGASTDDAMTSAVVSRLQQELELPVEVQVSYLDLDNDYQPGSQSARRLTTQSRNVVNLELAIAMTSTKAAQVADVILRDAWAERTSKRFSATRKWRHLDAADVVALPDGAVVRLTSIDYAPFTVVQCEGLVDLATVYISSAVGNDVNAAHPQTVLLEGPTRLALLDLPPLRDSDLGVGYYVGITGYLPGWRGAEIRTSRDNGGTWSAVTATTEDAIIGDCLTALGNCLLPHMLDISSTVTVSLTTPGATLSSVTDDQLLAGANVCAIGAEIVQFATATLNGDGTYTLSRFLRGRIGTEDKIATHQVGDEFVMLLANDIERIDSVPAEIGVTRLYQAQTFGQIIDEADNRTFTLSGRSASPLAPVHLQATRDRAGDWTFAWARRVRIGWWWADTVDVPLDEPTESYEVDIVNAGIVVRTIAVTSPSATYTSAQQLVDLGGGGINITWRVYQMSATVGRGLPAEAVAALPRFGRYPSLVLAAVPLVYIQDWISSTVVDDVGPKNLDGTFTGTKTVNQTDTAIMTESASRSCLFGGGYAQIADNIAFDITGDLTIEVWVKFSSANTGRPIVGRWHPSDPAQDSWLLQVGNVVGELEFYARVNGAQTQIQHTLPYNDNQWHHVVCVRQGASYFMYVDAVLRASSSAGVTGSLQNIALPLTIGAFHDGTLPFAGLIDDVAIYNVALSAADVVAHYNAARG